MIGMIGMIVIMTIMNIVICYLYDVGVVRMSCGCGLLVLGYVRLHYM